MSFEGRRRVAFVTGNRAEYDIQFPIADELRRRDEAAVGLIVTGSHLSRHHGETVSEIYSDGLPVWAELPSLASEKGLGARPRALSRLLDQLVGVIETHRPDIVFACGDREDVLAAAIASSYMNTIFCHYAAGDEAFDGNVDNAVRHASSKLAHVLMVTHPAHKVFLERCGESSQRIHVVGNSALDRIASTPRLNDHELEARLPYTLPTGPIALVIHHPTSRTVDSAAQELEAVLDAVDAAGLSPIVSYPNSDAGNEGMRIVLEQRRRAGKLPRVHHNLNRECFVNLVRRSSVIVGNSSMGILEAPSFKVPVVNVGIRQGRRLAGNHVVYCGTERHEIAEALCRVLDPKFLEKTNWQNPYGDGKSAPRIASLLLSLRLDDQLRFKRFEALREVFGG